MISPSMSYGVDLPALLERRSVAQYRERLRELITVGSDVHDRGEARVIDLAVVTLQIVLDDDLPVGGGVVRHSPIEAQPFHIDPYLRHQLGQCPERLGQRRRLQVGVDKDHQTRVSTWTGRRPSAAMSKSAPRFERGAERRRPSSS